MANQTVDNINKFSTEAMGLKDKAIKPSADLKLFELAAKKYNEAANLLEALIQVIKDEDDKIKSKALHHYYLHEAADCMYGFYRKQDELENCKDQMLISRKEIVTALSIIEQNINDVSVQTKEFLQSMRSDWTYRKLVADAQIFEPSAKMKMRNTDFIGALDEYKALLERYAIAKDYCFTNNLSSSLKRISHGNYFGQSVNVSQMYAGYISTLQKSENINSDLNTDLIGHFLDSLNLTKQAFISNPEWIYYRKGQDIIRHTLKQILSENKNSWEKYVIEFDNNHELIKTMKTEDIDHYKKIESKLSTANSFPKKLYFTGGFWLFVLLLVFWIFYSIFDSTIPLLLKPIAGLLIIVAFSVIGAFILRSTNELSEVGFLKLMRLSLTIGLEGIKSIGKKDT